MAYIATKPESFQSTTIVNPTTNHEWFTGPQQAKVVLVEYSDFQCPACAAYNPLVKQLSQEYAQKVKVVYRYFPLRQIHRNADASAYAAEAAGLQGKFWEMHDLLFENQTRWENVSNTDEIFSGYAKTLALDIARFQSDKNSDATKGQVQSDLDSGVKSQVDSTPTFFLNGQKIQNPRSYDEFKQVIDHAIAQNS